MWGDAKARFRFYRAFVRQGSHQAPGEVKLNGKFYTFRSAERFGDSTVYTYTFENLEPVLFELTREQINRLVRL